jgi:HPt (histidine-containing phosphotransfer) domain-containing protein
VIRLFLEEAPRQVDAVSEGLARGEQEEVRRSAHSLKSSAASVGAKDLSERSAKVEELTKARRLDDVLPLIEPLRSSLDQVSELLAAEAARLAPSSAGGSVTPPGMQ